MSSASTPAPGRPSVAITAPLSADAACGLAASLLAAPVTSATAVSSSAGNQVFRIAAARNAAGRQTAFLKIAGAAAIEREVAVLSLAGDLGLPVPALLAADPAGDSTGVPCVLIRHAGGRHCSGDSPEFASTGAMVRRLHEVRLAGFGSVRPGPGGLGGEDASWADSVRYRMSGLGPAATAGLVPAGLLDRAVSAVRARPHALAAAHGGRLLHGDLHPRHVYARAGRVTAIIDWADATCGDPVFDLGRVLHSATTERGLPYGFAVLRGFLDSYGDAPWLGPELTGSLLVHAAVFVLWAMRCEIEGGSPWPPWWPRQCAALTALLDELDRAG